MYNEIGMFTQQTIFDYLLGAWHTIQHYGKLIMSRFFHYAFRFRI